MEEMYSMIIRDSIDSDDIQILGTSLQQFHESITSVLTGVEMTDQYLYNRLVNCSRNVPAMTAGHCPRIFDSWSCFNSSPPDSVQYTPCPEFPALKFATQRFAYKYCTSEGEWWVHPYSNRTWSNYTNCVDWTDLNFRMTVNQVSVAGLCISILLLLVSTCIFSLSSSLQCGRIVMHNNLCISLLVSSLCWVLWHYVVLAQYQVWHANSVWCRALHVLTTYLTMTNYTWMLCEGAYLHFLLVMPFLQEDSLVKSLKVLGWLCPSVFVLPYTIYRVYHENYHCWMDLGDSNWFLGVPVIIIIVLNTVFLTKVLIIQRAKLSNSSGSTATAENTNMTDVTVKQTRAAMFLIPILGINFLLLPIRPEPGSVVENFYDIMSTVSTSFQGALVSCLLCFTNSQVKSFIKIKLRNLNLRWRSRNLPNTEMDRF